jgi:hypothetical protein
MQDSVAAAGGLFHNLGSFASVGSSTHASQMGSSEFLAISNMGHFGPSGEKVLAVQRGVMGTPTPSHVATVQEGGVGNQYLLHMGKRIGPAGVRV